ncbi:MAG: site-specific integrase [Coprococcus sp.]|nr:site-specific integrase [Clostridiales bacterium]MDD6466272.1 site-specific integrase [Coprococcus sp.]
MPVYKDEKRNTWYCKCNYRDWLGESKSKMKRGFATKKEALEWEREFLQRQSSSMDMKLSSFVDVYFDDKAPRLKERSIMTKRTLIETKILPYFGDKQMNDITAVDIIKWQNALLNQEYKPTYLRMIQNQLTALFNHAERFYDLKDNPCKKVDKMGRANAKELNFWTKDEFEVFIQCFTEEEEMYRIIFLMLFWLGCRVGELLALTESDIDLEGGTVSISKTYFRRNKTDYITAPKTESSNRKITIPQFLQDEIKQFLDRQYELMPEERIFPITDRAIQKKMKQKTEQAKLKPIRVHDLRHSHIALLIEKGMQPLVIAQRVGHDSVNTTMNIYGHLYPNKQKQVADLLNAEATGELKNNLVDMETEKRFRRAGGWS